MDLSNLSTSLRESESSTSNRRQQHLRSAEDDLNAFFRSSALGLTTLYRQGVAGAKASYDKGYAHALAHVLELWQKDKAWLKGYLQRRIEALEADREDDELEEQTRPQQQQKAATATPAGQVRAGETSTSSGAARGSNKRSRSNFSSERNAEVQNSPVGGERRTNRMPATSAAAFSSGFNFSTPLSMPAPAHAAGTKSHTRNTSLANNNTRADATPSSGGVSKTSTPAAQRRRLQKLKGLRSGNTRDRIIEIKPQPQEDDMVDDQVLDQDPDGDAWTDDDQDSAAGVGDREAKGTRLVWTDNARKAEQGLLERKDRRKRRRTKANGKDAITIQSVPEQDEVGDSSRERGSEAFAYHS
ncbi:uncharacterized protein UHOD_05334 [Ustilago sp. UG-2017b]|nr:uncharacterized protein UHOD_05334 [Ustilago sp. UG-2017b]